MTDARIRQLRNRDGWDGPYVPAHTLDEALDAIVELKKDVAALNKALVKVQKKK